MFDIDIWYIYIFIRGANRFAYIKRNQEIIDKSQFCVVYYDKEYKAKETRQALDYALRRNKAIYRFQTP